ncbi:MAG: hypothetical protein CL566_01750 [Alphaproteobacteria bacterium]|nr:hypothetical protein [Alphaproteobacteria bacterium]|tara:strand:- start:87 stop:491 length:405 start_codon:yes stop_codon:yes gene_type:complete
MRLILHAIILAAYCVLASAVALVAPAFVQALTPEIAPLAVAIVFLGCAVVHLFFAQANRNRRLTEELITVRRQAQEIAEDLLSTQTETLQLRQAIEQTGKAGEQRVSQVVYEVKVLQGLIEAFSRKQAENIAAG